MLQPFMRSKERPGLFVGGVTITRCPRPMLPEPSVGLLVPEEVMVVVVGLGPVVGKVIG